MMRWIFCGANGVWTLVRLRAGVAAYGSAGAPWDAGALDLFTAFWWAFAAVGFWRRSVWLVSMAAMVMAGLTGLETLMLVAGDLTRRAVLPADGAQALARVGGQWVLLAAGWIYALAVHRRDPGKDAGRS